MNPKMIALDLDGTVLTSDKRLTDRTRQAIQSAIEHQMEVVVVTGRPYHGIPDSILSIRGIRYLISSNGAVNYDRESERVLSGNYLDPDTSARICRLLKKEGVIYTVFAFGYGFCERPVYDRIMGRYEGTPLAGYMKKSRRRLEDPAVFFGPDSPYADKIENIWYKTESVKERDRILDRLRAVCGEKVSCILNSDTDAEYVSKEADKGKEVLALADLLGIEKDHILAIGDNANDAGMLRAAGIAVAMGNATPDIIELADYVTKSNDGEGVALTIEHFL